MLEKIIIMMTLEKTYTVKMGTVNSVKFMDTYIRGFPVIIGTYLYGDKYWLNS